MNIPDKIIIGVKEYSVIQNYEFQERNDRIGHCDNVRQRIVISNNDEHGEKPHRQRVEETFIHEALHAIDWIYNAGKLEEDDIARISEGVYQLVLQLTPVK